MSTTTDLRNRADPAAEDAIIAHLRDAERMAYAETRDYVPRYGGGMYAPDDDEAASGKTTAAVIGTLICCCLLLAGLAYLAWSGAHGGPPWVR